MYTAGESWSSLCKKLVLQTCAANVVGGGEQCVVLLLPWCARSVLLLPEMRALWTH